jgi:hypothetical protein
MKMNWKNLKDSLVKGTFFLALITVPLLSSCDQGNSGTNTDGGGTDTETDAGTDTGITTDTTGTSGSGTTDTSGSSTGSGGTQ